MFEIEFYMKHDGLDALFALSLVARHSSADGVLETSIPDVLPDKPHPQFDMKILSKKVLLTNVYVGVYGK